MSTDPFVQSLTKTGAVFIYEDDYPSFLRKCVALPIGSCLPLPKEWIPSDENLEAWVDIEDIQGRIREPSFMNEWYSLPVDEALVLLIKDGTWVIHHVKL